MPDTIEQIRSTASLIVPEIHSAGYGVRAVFASGRSWLATRANRRPGCGIVWGFVSLIGLGVAWLVWFNGGAGAEVDGTLVSNRSLVWYTRGLSLSAGIVAGARDVESDRR